MSHKNGKITKVINDTKYDIYVKTSADQVVYDDTTSVKQKMLEIINALNNGGGIGGGDSVSGNISSTEVDAKIKTACDDVFNKIIGTTDQADLNAAFDTLKEVSDYLAAHGTVVDGFTSDINDLKSKIEALNAAATHTNIDTLNKLSTSETGKLLFNGAEISSDNTGSTTEASWGSITGTLADQTDLKAALDAKANATDLDSKANTSDIPTVSNDLTNDLKASYDKAVTDSHTHTNKNVLDKFSASVNGKVLYDGAEITSSTEASWGSITGNIEDQTDLKAALDAKANTSDIPTVSNDLTNELKTKYDSAADNSHTHTNKDTIDKLSTSEAGKLLFDGKEIESGSGSSSSGTEGFKCVASGEYAHVEGCVTTASGKFSHAEGSHTYTSGEQSHAEGYYTSAYEHHSHAEGEYTYASGIASHAEGYKTTAATYQSHAEGNSTYASGYQSHAEGGYTTASNYASHAGGHYNATMTTGGKSNNTTGTAFVIGNGTSETALSNAFSIQYDGTVKAKSTITASTAADYAEFFEWKDGNPDNEDRVGKFVTIDGNKILIASNPDDYILGIVSGRPFVLGNGDCDVWANMHLTDEYNRYIMEPAPKMELDEETGEEKEVLDSEGNPVYYGTRPKLNPDYDPSQTYISRFDRKEWAPIGMLGVLSVNQDGTCEVNGYARCNSNGIATACKRTDSGAYRVTEVLSDSIIKVILK